MRQCGRCGTFSSVYATTASARAFPRVLKSACAAARTFWIQIIGATSQHRLGHDVLCIVICGYVFQEVVASWGNPSQTAGQPNGFIARFRLGHALKGAHVSDMPASNTTPPVIEAILRCHTLSLQTCDTFLLRRALVFSCG